MGSPDFAVPSLRELAANFNVVGVVTQPDRPAGRGRKLTPPPVKELALSLGLEVFQPQRLRNPENLAQLEAWAPDVIVVTAYGQILRKNVLTLPRFGCVNVHASMLPRWRGASPIQAAILHGDTSTGVTIMQMDEGIDTGPIFSQREIAIAQEDNAETLSTRLAEGGAKLLVETLPAILAGEIIPQPQPEEGATYAKMIKKAEGKLDFSKTAQELSWQVRAFTPWPGTFMKWREKHIKVHVVRADASPGAQPGKESVIFGLPAVGTAEGWLVLEQLQPAGKKRMSGDVFLRGARQWGQPA